MALTKVPSNLDATVATTQSASDNSTNVATTAYVTTAISNLVDGAPSTLNTLDEIAAALNDDAALNTTLTNSIATKLPLAGGTMTGNLAISAASSPKITITDTTNTVSLLMYSQDADAIIGTYTNHPFKLFSNSGLALTLDTSQNATFAGNIVGSDIKASGSGGLTLQTDEGTKRLEILDNGNIVINKSSFSSLPTGSKLNIFGDGVSLRLDGSAGTTKTILFRQTNAANPGEVYADGSLRFRTEDANTRITFHTNSSGSNNERMRIQSDGTTTIGSAITTTYDNDQGYPLHIQASTGNQSYLAISVPGANSGDTGLVIGHDPTGTRITNREADPIIFGISSSEKMRIHGNGNVGIGTGTAAPEGKLHVKGGASGSSYTPDGADRFILENNDSVAIDIRTPASNQALIMFSDGTRSQGLIGYNHSDDSLRFSNSGNLERMRIDQYGAIWHRHSDHGRYTWVQRVVFSGGQTKNLTFHLGGGNVHGQVRVTMSGDYSNVNANGSFEKVWGWGYNSSNTSGYGGQGSGTTIVNIGYTSNVMAFGSMSKTNATTVIIPITNTAASYSVICSIIVEITGELKGLQYTSI